MIASIILDNTVFWRDTSALVCLQHRHAGVVFVCQTAWSSTASLLKSSPENKRQLIQLAAIRISSLKRSKEAFSAVKEATLGHLIYLPSKLSLGCRRARVFVQDYGVLHLQGKLQLCKFLLNCTLKYQRPHICLCYCSFCSSLLFLNLLLSYHPPLCLLLSNWAFFNRDRGWVEPALACAGWYHSCGNSHFVAVFPWGWWEELCRLSAGTSPLHTQGIQICIGTDETPCANLMQENPFPF